MKSLIKIFTLLVILSGCSTIKNTQKSEKSLKPEPEIEKHILPEPEKKKEASLLDEDIGTIEIKITTAKKTSPAKKENSQLQNIKNNLESDNTTGQYKIREFGLKTASVEVDKTIHISISGSPWNVKSIKPSNVIELVKSESLTDNTVFQFNANNIGKAEIIFTRADAGKQILYRQPYMIIVIKKGESVLRYPESTKEKSGDMDYNSRKKEAISLFNDKLYEKSKAVFLKLLDENKSDSEVYYYLGLIEKLLLNSSGAIDYFLKVLTFKNSPFYLDSLIELINIYKNNGRYEDALELFSKLDFAKIKDKDKLRNLSIILGDLYFNLKKYSKSRDEYKRFTDLYPFSDEFIKALYFYALSLENLEVNPDFKEAYKIYKLIVAQYPSTIYYELSKNRILYLDRHYFRIN